MKTTLKSERITILGTPDFKFYLFQEAEKAGVSVSEFVRQRCEGKSAESQEEADVLADGQRAASQGGKGRSLPEQRIKRRRGFP